MSNKNLYVVTSVSNPVRFKSRYDLYREFEKYVQSSGAILYTAEMAFGDRPHMVTERDNPRHIQLRSYFEVWVKECMLNLAIQALPDDWEYVAWVDADVQFVRPDWVAEAVELLQHYHFIQMFSHAQDLSPNREPIGNLHNGFVHSWYRKTPFKTGYSNWHPGYAWAARREALDFVGGLVDHGILGSGDRHMACGLIGRTAASYNHKVHPNYKELCLEWQRRASKFIKRDIGYMPGLLTHAWHGSKLNRGYQDRWQILTKHQFDPFRDIYKDTQGLWVLDDEKIDLRDDIRRYFRSRHEDDTYTGEYKIHP